MKKSSKKRIIYKNIILFLFILVVVIMFIFVFGNKEDKLIYMIDTVNMDINDVNEMLEQYKLNININYEYSDIYENLADVVVKFADICSDIKMPPFYILCIL